MNAEVHKEPIWLRNARKDIGQTEVKGPNTNPRLEELIRKADDGLAPNDELAWCARFVNGTLAEAGIKGTRSAMARSFSTWGRNVYEEKALVRIPLGAVLVFSRPPSPSQGHVGFAVGYTRDAKVLCLGGNQKDQVRIDSFNVERLITARWPVEYVKDLRMEYMTIPMLQWHGTVSTRES